MSATPPPNSAYPPDAPSQPWPCPEGVPLNTTTQVCEQPAPLAATGGDGDALGVLALIAAVIITAGVGAVLEPIRKRGRS